MSVINLKKHWYTYVNPIVFRRTFDFLLHLKHIEELSLQFYSEDLCRCSDVLAVIAKLRSLRNLSVECNDGHLFEIGSCPKKLKYTQDEVISSIIALSGLKALKLEYVFCLHPIHLRKIIESFPSLEKLQLATMTHMKPLDYINTIASMSTLRVFDIQKSDMRIINAFHSLLEIRLTRRINNRRLSIRLEIIVKPYC